MVATKATALAPLLARRFASTRVPLTSKTPTTLKPVPRRPPPPTKPPPKPAAYKQPEPAGGTQRLRNNNNKSVWSSWKDLSYSTKLFFSAGIATFAVTGLLVADRLEELFPARNNRSSDRRSQISATSASSDPRIMDAPRQHPDPSPRLLAISVVDRNPRTSEKAPTA